MLILQRKKGQSLSINNTTSITVAEVGPDWVKLAIDAPKDVLVLRTELLEAVEENKAAAKSVSLNVLNQFLKSEDR